MLFLILRNCTVIHAMQKIGIDYNYKKIYHHKQCISLEHRNVGNLIASVVCAQTQLKKYQGNGVTQFMTVVTNEYPVFIVEYFQREYVLCEIYFRRISTERT